MTSVRIPRRSAADARPSATVVLPTPPLRLSTATVCTLCSLRPLRSTSMRPDAVHRVLDAELTAARDRRGGEPPRVLDVGGGSGVWAVPLAVAGCTVTVVDPSPDALATLHRRA